MCRTRRYGIGAFLGRALHGCASTCTEQPIFKFSICSSTADTCANGVFVNGGIFRYVNPSCRALAAEEIVTKGIGAVTVTTSVIESTVAAFACADVDSVRSLVCAVP